MLSSLSGAIGRALARAHQILIGPSAPYIGLLTLYTLLALAPLFAGGYFYEAHDGRHNVFYQVMFDAALRDGALWPRWAMHHIQGYGYPTFILQAPVGFYLGQLFVGLGAGFTTAIKWAWAVGFLVSGWGMYTLTLHWLRQGDESTTFFPLHRWAALIAALLYVFIPYHLAGIYVRAALNDTLLFAWFPWVFLAFDRLLAPQSQVRETAVNGAIAEPQAALPTGASRPDEPDASAEENRPANWGKRVSALVLAAFALAGALLTHTFALLSFAPLLVSFVLYRLALLWVQARAAGNPAPERWAAVLRSGLWGLAAGVAGLLLTAVFLLPLVAEGPHLEQNVYVEETYHYRQHFVYPGQFFSSFWGFGYSDDPLGANDGMGFQVGLIPLILLLAAVFQLWQRDEPALLRRGILFYWVGATVTLLVLMTPLALPVWDRLESLALIQFPWRLLSLVAFTVSALAGVVAANLLRWRTGTIPVDGAGLPDQNEISGSAVILIALVIFGSYGYIGARLQPVEPWREDGRAVFFFEAEHPDMIAFTEWVDEPFRTSPMTEDYADPAYTEAAARAGLLSRLAIIEGEGEVLSQYSGGSSAGGVVRTAEPAIVRVHLLYFPGWQATVGGEPVAVRVSPPHGLLELDVPPGEHEIHVWMGTTPARTTGALISWAIFVGLLVAWGVVWWRRPARPQP